MNSRRLLSGTATLALAAAGFLAPAFITQGSTALASPTVSTLAGVPAQAPTSITPGTRAQTQAVTMPTRRVRIRSHSDNPVVTIISLVLAVLIVGGGILVRYAIFKATQRNSTPPTAFNGPNGPQYGVTGANYGNAGTSYGTAGTSYGTAGTSYGTAGTGYGTATGAVQPGAPAYGTGAYGNQQGVQGPYGTGF